jgi:hypothetical protein
MVHVRKKGPREVVVRLGAATYAYALERMIVSKVKGRILENDPNYGVHNHEEARQPASCSPLRMFFWRSQKCP